MRVRVLFMYIGSSVSTAFHCSFTPSLPSWTNEAEPTHEDISLRLPESRQAPLTWLAFAFRPRAMLQSEEGQPANTYMWTNHTHTHTHTHTHQHTHTNSKAALPSGIYQQFKTLCQLKTDRQLSSRGSTEQNRGQKRRRRPFSHNNLHYITDGQNLGGGFGCQQCGASDPRAGVRERSWEKVKGIGATFCVVYAVPY